VIANSFYLPRHLLLAVKLGDVPAEQAALISLRQVAAKDD